MLSGENEEGASGSNAAGKIEKRIVMMPWLLYAGVAVAAILVFFVLRNAQADDKRRKDARKKN